MAASSSASGRCGLSILGVDCDLVGADQVRAEIRRFLADPWDGRLRQIVTLNPEYVMEARRNGPFAAAINDADLVTADGVGVVVAARLLAPDRALALQRVTGVEVLQWLASESVQTTAPLFLLGGHGDVPVKTAERLRALPGGALIAGHWSAGSPDQTHDAESIARIRDAAARIVAVAYGAPHQVIWIERNRTALADAGVRVAIGVGGAFDYLSGNVRRPPRLVRRVGLEWLVRLVREPSRWRRQRVLPVFAWLVMRQAIRDRAREWLPRSR